MKKINYVTRNQILADVDNTKSLSIIVDNAGALTDDNGVKYHPAGTPVGGDASPFEDETAVVTNTNNATDATKSAGVLLHDVYFDDGETEQNATLLYFGTVNENRLDSALTIVDEVKTALDAKVYFVKRN